jgi:hypothetical protein
MPMAETFLEPQAFNVEIGPERDVTPAGRMPSARGLIPVLAQEITPDKDLYPPVTTGVKDGVIQ